MPYQRKYPPAADFEAQDSTSYEQRAYDGQSYDGQSYDQSYEGQSYDQAGYDQAGYAQSATAGGQVDPDLRTGASYRPVSHRGAETAGAFTAAHPSSAGASPDFPAPERDTTEAGLPRRPTASVLAGSDSSARSARDEDSGPEPSPPGQPRDRLLVHWLWELVLLLAVGGLGYLVWRVEPDLLRGDGLSGLLVLAAGYGLLGLGAGATLRAGVPNLAIGPVAAASMIYFAQRGGEGVLPPTVFAAGAALVLGAAVAVLVLALRVPGWAASLAAAVAVLIWIQLQPSQVELAGFFDPVPHGTTLFLAVAAAGMLGGAVAAIPAVRQAVGGRRPVGDPAERTGGALPAAIAAGTIMLSMVLAVPAGVLLAASAGEPVAASSGLELTVVGLAIALIGGTSVFGRRGGVFGGTLAVIALVLFQTYQAEQGWRISLLAIAAVGLVLGLAVSRLVEFLGRRRLTAPVEAGPADEPAPSREEPPQRPRAAESEPARAPTAAWSSPHDSWSSSLPAQPAHGHADPWTGEDWRPR